jgi:hypothetical protein
MKYLKKLPIFTAVLFSVVSTLSAAEIYNGTFDNLEGTFVANDAVGLMELPSGSTAIPGWKVISETGEPAAISWVDPSYPYVTPPPGSSFTLDLTDYYDGHPYGGITQDVATEIGVQYRLVFYIGALRAISGDYVQLDVSAGSELETITYTPSTSGLSWREFTFDFTAASTLTPISFVGKTSAYEGGTHDYYIGLADVRIDVVPEPATYALLIGAGFLILFSKRRSRVA